MAYTVDWIGKVISIPTSDLTLVSGTHYQLQMSAFLVEIRRLESAFNEGLWADQILDHTNPKLDFAGIDFAGFDEVINGYTIQVTGAATRVDLLGSNNNIIDVLIATGVSVVPSNSAGLQIVATGSGVTEQDKTDIVNQTWQYQCESGYEVQQLLRGFCAALYGKASGLNTNNPVFRDISDTKNRIVATTDNDGNRMTITLDLD